jgi:hypothetical protein
LSIAAWASLGAIEIVGATAILEIQDGLITAGKKIFSLLLKKKLLIVIVPPKMVQ